MRTTIRGVCQAMGWLSVVVLLAGCPKLGAGDDADAAAEDEGSSGDGGQGGSGGSGGSADKDGGAASEPACNLACEAYQHCELVEVTCIQAPCPPQPECVDNPFCGGIAGFVCPGAGVCQDDPRDDCDPKNGGADCGGVCVCSEQGGCAPGETWDAAKCACVAYPADAGAGGGVACGKNTCEAGQVCCNASCGICAPPDGACIQIACL